MLYFHFEWCIVWHTPFIILMKHKPYDKPSSHEAFKSIPIDFAIMWMQTNFKLVLNQFGHLLEPGWIIGTNLKRFGFNLLRLVMTFMTLVIIIHFCFIFVWLVSTEKWEFMRYSSQFISNIIGNRYANVYLVYGEM